MTQPLPMPHNMQPHELILLFIARHHVNRSERPDLPR